jgi:hypothetical protein
MTGIVISVEPAIMAPQSVPELTCGHGLASTHPIPEPHCP